jgi:hypothetical protein
MAQFSHHHSGANAAQCLAVYPLKELAALTGLRLCGVNKNVRVHEHRFIVGDVFEIH